MFYIYKLSIKLRSNVCVIYLYISKVIFAPLAGLEMRTTQIFLLFFCNYFFLCLPTFWFRGFVFEWDLQQARETRWYLRAVAGHEIWHWAARF